MPSLTVLITLFLLASIAGLCAVLVAAQRQYVPPAPAGRPAPSRSSDPGPRFRPQAVEPELDALAARLSARAVATGDDTGPLPGPGRLPLVLAAALEATNRVAVRNSSEAQAAASLRSALGLALKGGYSHDVRVIIDGVDGVQSFHDIRKLNCRDLVIDHLVVSPRGVFVIDSVARAPELAAGNGELGDEGLTASEGADPFVDAVLAKVAAVAALVEPTPVQGLIVVEDRQLLPPELRGSGMTVRGVHLTIAARLPARLTTGLALAEALDVEAVWARLFPAFGPALDVPDHPFAVATPDSVPSALPAGR